MKYYIMILLPILILSCQGEKKGQNETKIRDIDLLFEKNFQHSLISRGDNFPDFNYTKDSMDLFLISLHENILTSSFIKKTGFSKEKIIQIEKLLKSKNWLHYINGQPKPSVFIATEEEGNKLFEYSTLIANEIVVNIERELPFNKSKVQSNGNIKRPEF